MYPDSEYVIVEDKDGRPIAVQLRQPEAPKRSIKFSSTEITHLAISVGILTLAFAFSALGGALSAAAEFFASPFVVLFIVGVSFVSVASGFVLHELGHKVVAIKYGCWAEYRMSLQGLGIAFLLSLVGFLFASPGAVMIYGNLTKKSNGLVSLAGPLVNVVIAVVCLAAGVMSAVAGIDLAAFAFIWVARINAMLGAFNMIPFPPLDGSKIIKWSIPIYIAAAVVAGGLAVFLYIFLYF